MASERAVGRHAAHILVSTDLNRLSVVAMRAAVACDGVFAAGDNWNDIFSTRGEIPVLDY